MAEIPLAHEQVKRQLLDRLGRQWRPGMRLPSSADLAKQLGTGQRNTHRAMAELASEGLLVARRGKGTFVAEDIETLIHRGQARGVLAGRSITVLTSERYPGHFIEQMAEAVSAPLTTAGAGVTRDVFYADRHRLDEDRFRDLDALIMVNPDKTTAITCPPGKALLILSTSSEVVIHAGGGYDVVSADDQQGGFLAGQTLRRAGCKRVCFLGVRGREGRGAYDRTSAARLRGLEAGFGERLDDAYQLKCRAYMSASGGRAVAGLMKLKPRPDGIFAASDEIAVGFAIGASAVGLEPGRDYKLVGFDGQEGVHQTHDFEPITTVEVPSSEMGRRGAELLTHRIIQADRPSQRVLLSCGMFAGQTCHPSSSSS